MRYFLTIFFLAVTAQAQVNAWSLGWTHGMTTAVNFDEGTRTHGPVANWAKYSDTAVMYGGSPIAAFNGRRNSMNTTTVGGRANDFSTAAGLDKTKPFTISMWVYTTLTGAIDTLWGVGATGAGSYSGQSFQDASYHIVYNGSQGVDAITDARCAKLPTSQWVHYVVTYDGTYTDVTSWKVYYNKVSQTMSNYTSNNTGLNPTSVARWCVIHQSTGYLFGYMDNIQFYDRVLTQSEVNTLYEEGLVNK